MPNILITTLGTTWTVIPELYGFTNPHQLDLYRYSSRNKEYESLRKQYQIEPVDEIWIVTTLGPSVQKGLDYLIRWSDSFQRLFRLRIFQKEGVVELSSPEECNQMTDLIFRVVFHAREKSQNGQILLSLAGGRKTMSADLQEAAHIFGCHALLHVVDTPNLPSKYKQSPSPEIFCEPLPFPDADTLIPLVIRGKLEPSPLLYTPSSLQPDTYPLVSSDQGLNLWDTQLLQEIVRRQQQAVDLFTNYSRLITRETLSNFRALYQLPPEIIQLLQEQYVGKDPACVQEDRSWLRKLPKVDLHCHFGGILDSQGIIRVAQAVYEEWRELLPQYPELVTYYHRLCDLIKTRDIPAIHRYVKSVKDISSRFPTVPFPFAVITTILAFENAEDLFDQFLFTHPEQQIDYRDSAQFHRVGIDTYTMLGDIQGSALLQHPKTIQAACRELLQYKKDHHVVHLELRCSPAKYTRGGWKEEDILRFIIQSLPEIPIIIIASRHGKMSEIYHHIELVQDFYFHQPEYAQWVVGFDLAGPERFRSPAEVREAFMPLLKECFYITIHAGEEHPDSQDSAHSIWEAIYHLQADRLGHALSLMRHPELINKLIRNKVGIELCPSSNRQIVGFFHPDIPSSFQDPVYPLKEYLERGLKVSVNTDNPGISRTTITEEYYQAARMVGGLSRWYILQLIRNSLLSAFLHGVYPSQSRRELILRVEKELMGVITQDYQRIILKDS